jgi:hypothetical protein
VATKTVFEELGYGKFDPKPEYCAYSLVKTKEGWVVFEIVMKGITPASISIVCQPTVKALAAEKYRIYVARSIREPHE